MRVFYSIFYNCLYSVDGGAIYFQAKYLDMRMVCGNGCSANSQFHFAYNMASQVNQMEYLSILNYSYLRIQYYSIQFDTCSQRMDYRNSSINNAYQCSGIYIYSPSSFTSSYCSFPNNKAENCFCIQFISSFGKYQWYMLTSSITIAHIMELYM